MNNRRYSRGSSRVRRERYSDDSANPYFRDAEVARTRPAGNGLTWKKIDLHLHTPASSDYRDPGISYLDILKKAEERGLDMIAFADHNTVSGYAAMHQEIETLTLLEKLGRINDDERNTLNEYRRLLKKLVVLPGFEFTATFGFHILGLFPEGTSTRKLEYMLLNLNVPEERMVRGAPDVGSTSDVLAAYAAITAAGGMAIAAHANSSNGVAMQGFPFGGQTKIAYTQDPNLICLEVTDLDVPGRRTTANFYNGTKTEYPRRMHCIQGSDAHSLDTEQSDSNNKRLGVGARVTEVLMRETSFAALREVLQGDDYTRIRPYRPNRPWELVEAARAKGPTQIVAFHERAVHPTTRTRPIMQDVVAFANGYGGIIYIGVSSEANGSIQGLDRPEEAIRMLREDVHRSVEPPLDVNFDIKEGENRGIVVMNVPGGDNRPYVYTPTGQVYLREGGTSVLATRSQMVKIVLDAARAHGVLLPAQEPARETQQTPIAAEPRPAAEPSASPRSRQAAGDEAQSSEENQPRRRRDNRPPREDREERPAQEQNRPELAEERRAAAPTEQPTAPAPTPTPTPTHPVRRPALHNLPPEKIKGQVQPMARRGEAPPAPGNEQPSLQTVPLAHKGSLPEVTPAGRDGEEPMVVGFEPVIVDQPPAVHRRRPGSPIPEPSEEFATTVSAEETASAAESVKAAAETAAESLGAVDIEEPPANPTRGRTRRKTATAETEKEEAAPKAKSRSRSRTKKAAPEAEAAETVEITTPMEATVAAEHLSREEIIEAEAEKPKRGRGRTRSGRSKAQEVELEIEAPTAAAAATEAGTEAILTEAEVEPGAQIPGELEETPEAPAKKARSRRKTAAQKAAEAAKETAAAQGEPQEATPNREAPTQAKPRRRRTKKSEATPGPAGEEMPGGEPPDPPTTGVEIIGTETGGKSPSYTMRDVRNGQTVSNVTRQSARRLWHYAITQHERGNPALSEVLWHGNLPIGLWRRDERAGAVRYDLVSRYPDGSMRIFYGVTDDGLAGPWRELVGLAEEAGYTGPDVPE